MSSPRVTLSPCASTVDGDGGDVVYRGVVGVTVLEPADADVKNAEQCACGPCPTRPVARNLAGSTRIALVVSDVRRDLTLVPATVVPPTPDDRAHLH